MNFPFRGTHAGPGPACRTAVLAVMLLVVSTAVAFAQPGSVSSDRVWTEIDNSIPQGMSLSAPDLDPSVYKTYELNLTALQPKLDKATPFTANSREGTELYLPMGDGSFQRFEVYDRPIFAPDVAANYPQMQSYLIKGIDDPTASGRAVIGPLGFSAFIRSLDGFIIVEPYEFGKRDIAIAYNSQNVKGAPQFECLTEHDDLGEAWGPQAAAPFGDFFRTYRLAVATTGEFTQNFDPGGGTANTANNVLASVAAVNAIYGPEVGIQFQVVCAPNSYYTNPGSDPFTNPGNSGTSIGQTQTTLDNDCGDANYDVGHCFHIRGSGFSGLGSLGVPCVSGSKGRGYSSVPNPVPGSTLWVVDLLCHEMGHQFNAPHSWNALSGRCTAGQRTAGSAYEIGSGASIMSYNAPGGSPCIPDSPEPNNLPYFHANSADQITSYRDGTGNCPAADNSFGNSIPSVNAGPNWQIPQGTPFRLTADGSDPDGDAVTYSWEQFDLGNPPETATSTTGPLFRSRPATITPTRVFPIMSDILAGNPTPTEILPLVDRALNFRCTIRDNHPISGGVNNDAMVITVSGAAHEVLSPNGGEELYAGCPQEVTWDPGDGIATIVNILFSDDSGATWTTLAEGTLNDGKETVEFPCAPTTTARIMVEAADNIYFDVSDQDFSLVFPEITLTGPISRSYNPPNPWGEDGITVDFLTIEADVDLFNIQFSADALQDPDAPCNAGLKKFDSSNIKFVPSVIGFLEAGQTAQVEVKFCVPVGQHVGDYDGEIHVIADHGCSCPPLVADIDAHLTVSPVADMDVDDNEGNMDHNVVHLIGAKNDVVSATVNVINPNSRELNVDPFDGAGNIKIEPGGISYSDLVKVGDPAVIIPSGNYTFGTLEDLEPGEAQSWGFELTIPDGIPVDAYYEGEITLIYFSCLGGDAIEDTFNVRLHLQKTQGTLDIVEECIELDFCPPDPWIMVGQVEFTFDIHANGDHRNVRVASGGLEHETMDKKLDLFNWFPEEFALITAGETRTERVIVKIPIGQHAGLYTGHIVAVSENGGEDSVKVQIDICELYDLDIKDHYANLGDNVMEINALANSRDSGGEWMMKAFDIGLPNELINNHDEFDGPSNTWVDSITCEFGDWSAKWQTPGQENYHTNHLFTGTGSVTGDFVGWESGTFKRMLVGVYVPPMKMNQNHPGTYRNTVECHAWYGGNKVASDKFEVELQLSRVVGPGSVKAFDGAFGGAPTGDGARLYWGGFTDLGVTGDVNLYREEGSGYVLLREGLPQDSEYLDSDVSGGMQNSYKLGLKTANGEILVGPVKVGSIPNFVGLSQNYPNPFRTTTEIRYNLPTSGQVSLRVYDVAGRLVRTLADNEQIAGFKNIAWDGRTNTGARAASGVYYYRLVTPEGTLTKKMVIVR